MYHLIVLHISIHITSPSLLSSSSNISFLLPDDDVFLADEKEREEFVFNSSGQMWVGSHDNNSPIPWEYDQVSCYQQAETKHTHRLVMQQTTILLYVCLWKWRQSKMVVWPCKTSGRSVGSPLLCCSYSMVHPYNPCSLPHLPFSLPHTVSMPH